MRFSAGLSFQKLGLVSIRVRGLQPYQRRHYIPPAVRAGELDQTTRVLLLDDFIMSGDTSAAMQAALHRDKSDAFSGLTSVGAIA